MQERKCLNGYYNYTVVLTYIGMLSGFTGILYVMENKYYQSIICLMLAGVCDMFDGTIAATKKRDRLEKKFGIQIDSLSDLICFGVLPSLIIYSMSGKTYWGVMICAGYTLCALIRLAYFNVLEEERQDREDAKRTYYQGLPVTVSALAVPAVYMVVKEMKYGNTALLQMLLLVMAIAFISPCKIKKPYLLGKIGIIFTGIIEFVILLIGLGMKV